MIDAIKVTGHKGIKNLELANLGHINVLSGKNNSGKTSILEAINSANNRMFGFKYSEGRIIQLCEEVSNECHLGKDVHNQLLRISLHLKDNIIYDMSGEKFRNALNAISNLQHYIGMAFLTRNDMWWKQVKNSFKSVLIPAKRTLIKSEDQVEPKTSGENLIQHLFHLKNQLPGSTDRLRFEMIGKHFSMISDGLFFDVNSTDKNDLGLNFSEDQKNWHPAHSCGLGLQDLLTIITDVIAMDYNFIMIEEPENHIHPDMQRKLLQFLNSVTEKQFLIASHSNVFLDTSYINRMFLIEKNESIRASDKTLKANILKDLGYSVVDNFNSDLIVLTEGPRDVEVIEEICKKMGFWDKSNIKFWPLGGDTMARIDLTTLLDNISSKKIIAIIDSDPVSKSSRETFKEQCNKHGIKCIQLENYAIENYIPLETLRNSQLPIPEGISSLDPKVKLFNQIKCNIKGHLRKLTKDTELAAFQGTDLFEFCETLQKMAS